MRKLAAWAAAVGLMGCGGGVTKQELDAVRAELLANDARSAASLKTELTGIDQKYVTVQQLQNRVEKQLEELAKLQKDLQELSKKLDEKVSTANANVVRVFEFEEKLLADRLATVRALLEELRKK
jgi:succinate dehydrogenase/fumarate reductase flavoprotein subunit